MDRFCDGCCLEHLPKDCPTRLSSAHATEAKASVNYIEVISSPHEEEAEADRRSLNVITRSKSKKKMATLENKEAQMETPVKKKRGRKPCSRRSKKAKSETQENPKDLEGVNAESQAPNHLLPRQTTSLSQSFGGLIIVNKIHEPLQAALDAYNDRITPLTEIPKKLQEYPNPREEKVRLAIHQELIRDTQTMLEGPPPAIKRGPVSKQPNLTTILEATSSQEQEMNVDDQKLSKEEENASMESILDVDE